jgi:uncharacterized protein YhaN
MSTETVSAKLYWNQAKKHHKQIAELTRQVQDGNVREAFWRDVAERLAARLKTFQNRSEGLNAKDFAALKDFEHMTSWMPPVQISLQRTETNPNTKP